VIIAILGGFLVWSTFYPRDAFAASESGFVVFLGGLFILPSSLSLVLLSVPQTRRYFFMADIQKQEPAP
jgi:hypothetical protein